MSTQFKITYQGTSYNYTSNIANKTVNSIAYTAKTISRSEIFFELDRQSCTVTVDASIAPFSLIKDRRPQVEMSIDILDNAGAVLLSGEVSDVNVTTANNLMKIKIDAMRKIERGEIPNRTISPVCSFSVYEGFDLSSGTTRACPVNRASHKSTYTSVSVLWSIDSTDKRKLNWALGLLASNAFQQGHAVFNDASGNELARYYIITNLSNSITFLNTIDLDLSTVNSFDVYLGCNKSLVSSGKCQSTFGVGAHFGGFPLAFNHGGEKLEAAFIPIAYGKEVHVKTKIIYALDKALVPVYDADYPFLEGAYAFMQSFGLGLAKRADNLHQIYKIDGNGTKFLCTPNGMAALTAGQATTAILPSSFNEKPLNETSRMFIFGLEITAQKNGYLGKISENVATFYDGTQSAVDPYYNAYATTTGNINTMFYKDVAKVDIGFNGLAKALSDASSTANLARMKNYNGGINAANATQALVDLIPELNFQDLGQQSFPLPDLKAVISYSPEIAGVATNKTIGSGDNQGANPANVVYDLLVNHANIDAADIDTTSFANARNTLAGETIPLGVNLVVEKPKSVKKIIDDVCAFAGMVLVKSTTGSTGTSLKWALKVLRFTDTGTAAVYPSGNQFNASNSSNVKLKFTGFDKIYSDIKVELFEPNFEKKTDFVFVNEAARNLIGGVKSKKISFGDCKIYGRDILKAIISREASKLTRPLNQISFKFFETPNSSRVISVGDVVYYKNAQYGITDYKAFRVIEISGLREANFERTIKAIELWDETAFANLPDDFIVPDKVTAGTAGDKYIIPAAQEQCFPFAGVTGAIENTDQNSAYGSDLWTTKPLDRSAGLQALAKLDIAMQGTITNSFSENQFIDNTGTLKFTLNSGSSDYLSNLEITEDEFYSSGGLFAIVGTGNEYEFLSIRKITHSGGTYTCYDVIRNYYGGWNASYPLFGKDGEDYEDSKIYIYGETGGGSNSKMKSTFVAGNLTDGADISLTSGDKYLVSKNQYKYLLGATQTAAAEDKTLILDYTGDALAVDYQGSCFPYPITDGVARNAGSDSVTSKALAVTFSPCFPRAPKGCNIDNKVKETGWGYSGDYERGVDLPDYWVDIIQSGVETRSIIVRYGDYKYNIGAKGGSQAFDGADSISLFAVKNGTAEDLYKEGYLVLTIEVDTSIFSDADSLKIYSFWNGVKSDPVSFNFI